MSNRTVRVELPLHLRRLANITGYETTVVIDGPITLSSVLAALEARYPMLAGTIRDHVTRERRAFLRFFAAGEDWSFAPHDQPLPTTIAEAREPLIILGAIAGG